jgi:hypothetical protein
MRTPSIALASRTALVVARFTWVALREARPSEALLERMGKPGLKFADLGGTAWPMCSAPHC